MNFTHKNKGRGIFEMQMNYSFRFISSFDCAHDGKEVSSIRLLHLCNIMGRINMGSQFIFIPGTPSGHAVIRICEEVITKSGKSVGVINESYYNEGFVGLDFVRINSKLLSIPAFNRAVTELRKAIRNDDRYEYTREEILFALSLLCVRASGCRYILIEGNPKNKSGFFKVCRDCVVSVVPPVYSEFGLEEIEESFEVIKNSAVYAVCCVMNKSGTTYHKIKRLCMNEGTKLIEADTAKVSLNICQLRRTSFSYKGNTEFMIKCASRMCCDCSVTAFEVINALKNFGLSVTQSQFLKSLCSITKTGLFEILSFCPTVIADSAESFEEVELLIENINEVFDGNTDLKLIFCIKEQDFYNLSDVFLKFNNCEVYSVGNICFVPNSQKYKCFESIECLCDYIIAQKDERICAICVGGVSFTSSFTNSYVDRLSKRT